MCIGAGGQECLSPYCTLHPAFKSRMVIIIMRYIKGGKERHNR